MEMSDLVQCVEKALSSFGMNMKQATYFSMESREGMGSDEILSNPEAFIRTLKNTFGPGYQLAERRIVKEINALCSPSKSSNLLDALEMAKGKITDFRGDRDSAQFMNWAAAKGPELDADAQVAPVANFGSGNLTVAFVRQKKTQK